MKSIKNLISIFKPKNEPISSHTNYMEECQPLMNIPPYSTDFVAAYLCFRFKLSNCDDYFNIKNLLVKFHTLSISNKDFELECKKNSFLHIQKVLHS